MTPTPEEVQAAIAVMRYTATRHQETLIDDWCEWLADKNRWESDQTAAMRIIESALHAERTARKSASADCKKYAEEMQQVAEAVGMPVAPGRMVIERVREIAAAERRVAELERQLAALRALLNPPRSPRSRPKRKERCEHV